MTETSAERYLRLGLQLGRHVDGLVDAYYGPPELKADVDAAPPVEPRALVAQADDLLDELDEGWLRDQAAGLRTYAGVLAGESRSFADEAEGCYAVRPVYTDESVFEAAHERLEELLPGDGPLSDRYARWEESIRVPVDQVERTAAAAIAQARAATRRIVQLPEGEDVELELVRDEAWLAFCEYHGALTSGIAVNVDLPISALELLVIAIHETYPGHHTERCCKEQLLVRGRGLLEETIVLVPTPQSLVAEGIAKLAPAVLLESDDGEALAAVIHDAGIDFDLGLARAVRRVLEPCQWAEVNATLMLYEDGATEEEVHGYLRRWELLTPELADHMIRFFKDPTSRSYVLTYPAGLELCEAYVGGDPERFRRLLTEQVRIGELVAARDAAKA
ncbi:MAG TPA: hypothetical protein VLK36_12565 [Gaiellaceae bacterium]|nr:hypothetical protein [Gaiellaceae bacterium]